MQSREKTSLDKNYIKSVHIYSENVVYKNNQICQNAKLTRCKDGQKTEGQQKDRRTDTNRRLVRRALNPFETNRSI